MNFQPFYVDVTRKIGGEVLCMKSGPSFVTSLKHNMIMVTDLFIF